MRAVAMNPAVKMRREMRTKKMKMMMKKKLTQGLNCQARMLMTMKHRYRQV